MVISKDVQCSRGLEINAALGLALRFSFLESQSIHSNTTNCNVAPVGDSFRGQGNYAYLPASVDLIHEGSDFNCSTPSYALYTIYPLP